MRFAWDMNDGFVVVYDHSPKIIKCYTSNEIFKVLSDEEIQKMNEELPT